MSLREPPYRLCCGQQHWGPTCPDGLVMCQLCYERKTIDELHELEDGYKENACQQCFDQEQLMLRIRAI
jgi:hypothetical protein